MTVPGQNIKIVEVDVHDRDQPLYRHQQSITITYQWNNKILEDTGSIGTILLDGMLPELLD